MKRKMKSTTIVLAIAMTMLCSYPVYANDYDYMCLVDPNPNAPFIWYFDLAERVGEPAQFSWDDVVEVHAFYWPGSPGEPPTGPREEIIPMRIVDQNPKDTIIVFIFNPSDVPESAAKIEIEGLVDSQTFYATCAGFLWRKGG